MAYMTSALLMVGYEIFYDVRLSNHLSNCMEKGILNCRPQLLHERKRYVTQYPNFHQKMCKMLMNLDCSTVRVRHEHTYWLKRKELRLVAHQCRSTKTVSQSFCVSILMDHINTLQNILENQDLQLHSRIRDSSP